MTRPDDRLRGSERTAEGVHLPEPDDAFPHAVMGRLALLLVVLAAAAWASYAIGGVVGVFIGSLAFMLLVLPILVRRMSASAQVNRERDLDEERELEERELASEGQEQARLDDERDTTEHPVAVMPPAEAATRDDHHRGAL